MRFKLVAVPKRLLRWSLRLHKRQCDGLETTGTSGVFWIPKVRWVLIGPYVTNSIGEIIMAITKKFKVSFDVTLKLDSETEEMMRGKILDLAHRAGAGEKIEPMDRELLVQALTNGPDGAAAFAVRQGLRNAIKELFEKMGDASLFKASPATVREVF